MRQASLKNTPKRWQLHKCYHLATFPRDFSLAKNKQVSVVTALAYGGPNTLIVSNLLRHSRTHTSYLLRRLNLMISFTHEPIAKQLRNSFNKYHWNTSCDGNPRGCGVSHFHWFFIRQNRSHLRKKESHSCKQRRPQRKGIKKRGKICDR